MSIFDSNLRSVQPSLENRAATILARTSLSVLLISIVALSVLFTLSYFQILPQVSPLVLYLPPSCLGGMGALLGIAAIAKRCSKEKVDEKKRVVFPLSHQGLRATSSPENESPLSTPSKTPVTDSDKTLSITPSQEEKGLRATSSPENESPLSAPSKTPVTDSDKTLSITPSQEEKNEALPSFLETWLTLFQTQSTLHPKTEGERFPLKENPPIEIDDSKKALSCFLLLVADFMGLKTKGYICNSHLSLSFLIHHLEKLKNEGLITDLPVLDEMIHKFRTAYRFADYMDQLKGASSVEAYNKGKEEIVFQMLDTLEREGNLLLNAGYAGEKIGHAVALELTLKEGMVEGLFLNRGEGVNTHHPSLTTETSKYKSLQLSPIPLERFKDSLFLSLLIDLQQTTLENMDQKGGEWKLRTKTCYSIEEVYEILLFSWPGTIQKAPNKAHGPQFSGSCSLTPFLAVLSESFKENKKDAKTAKLYLMLASLEHVLQYANFEELDLSRIKDALAELNRFVTATNRQNRLNPYLKERALALTKETASKIHDAEEKILETRLNTALSLEQTRDENPLTIPLPLGRPLQAGSPKEPSHETLPPYEKSHLSSFLQQAKRLVKQAKKEKQLHEAMQIARQALLAIPNPSDPIWETDRPEDDIHCLTFFARILTEEQQTRNTGPNSATANSATLYLKALTILLKQAACTPALKEIVQYYASQARLILEQTAHAYHLTHPTYAGIFLDCSEFFKKQPGEAEPIRIEVDHFKHLYFKEKRYSSLVEMRKDIELRFLNDCVQKDPDLSFGGVYSEMLATALLFGDLNRSKHIALRLYEGKLAQKWKPIRQWIRLRRLYYFTLASAYLVVKQGHGSPVRFRGGHHADEEVETDISLYPTPKNLDKLYEGIFQDTFFSFSDRMQKNLTELFDRSGSLQDKSQKTQNEQLQFQQGFKLDSDLTLTPQEMQHLLSIRTYDELMIPQLLSFFMRHFHRLNDPRFQALFALYLFGLNKSKSALILQEVLRSPSFIKNHLFHFLKTTLKQTEQLGWSECHFFFLRILAQTGRFLADESPNNPLLNEMIGLMENKMAALLKSKQCRGLYTLVSCVPYLDYTQAKPLLEICQSAKIAIQKENYLLPFSNQLQLQEDCTQGIRALRTIGESKEVFPDWIIKHNDYFFGRNFNVTTLSEGLYAFYGDQGEPYQLAVDGHKIHIYQNIQGRWYEHQNSFTFLEKTFPNIHPCSQYGYFTTDTRCWVAPDMPQEAYIFSKKTHQTLCRVTEEGIFHPTLPELTLATDYNIPIVNYIAHLHRVNQILVWKKGGEIVHIAIPHYGLNFYLAEGKWKSSLHPGYFLDSRVCPTLEPGKYYVCMRNDAGKRIALIPNWHFAELSQIGFNPLKGKRLEFHDLTLQVFELDSRGLLKMPENNHHKLYLIYLAMRKCDYALAEKILGQLKRERPVLENKECKWIRALDKEHHYEDRLDRHPAAISLRLRLRLMMLDLANTELEKVQLEGLKRDYFLYLEVRKHAFGARLNQQEEKACYKILSRKMLSGDFSNAERFQKRLRQHILDPSARVEPKEGKYSKTIPTPKKIVFPDFDWISEEIRNEMVEGLTAPQPVFLQLRPGSPLIHNFLYYYAIARHLPPENPLFKELKNFLRICRFDDCNKLSSLHALLLGVMNNPSGVPSIEQILQEKKFKTTFKNLMNSVEKSRFSPIEDHKLVYDRSWSFKSLFNSYSKTKIKRVDFEPSNVAVTPEVYHEASEVKDLKLLHLLDSQKWEIRAREIEQDLSALSEMKAFFEGCQNEDPCVTRQFARLIRGILKKEERLLSELEQKICPYTLNLGKLEEIKDELQALHLRYAQLQEDKKKKILKIAHAYPDFLLFEKEGRMLTPLSLKELLVLFGTGYDEAIYASNPSLSGEDMARLKTLLADYLIISTDLRQILRLSNCLEEVQKQLKVHGSHSQEVKAASCEFIETATAQRVYNPVEQPHVLAFEFFGKLRLREDQYLALNEMTGTEENLELEARTGFGKSKVLIPLWLFLKSRKDRAAMMVVPPSLFLAEQKHLRSILGKAFDLWVVPLLFDREKANHLPYLKSLRRQLEDAQKNHKILLTTIPSLHGMVNLKLKEALATASGNEGTKRQTQLIDLRAFIAAKVASFFDESKVCFNIRQRYDYAVGAPSYVDPKFSASASLLYRLLILEGSIRHQYNFEFLPESHSLEKTTPVQENYEKDLLPKFALRIAEYFNVPREYEKVILEDLQGHYSKKCEGFYALLSHEKLEEYDHCKKQLTDHLRRTLYRKCEDGYGFYPGTRLAIPFLDGVLKKTSEFSEVEDCIDFTIQANLKMPFSQEDIAAYIQKLKVRAIKEELKENELRLLSKLSDFSLMSIKECHYQAIADAINGDLSLKLEFIETAILPQIKVYKQKITSSSFNLIRAIHHVQAASGTVDPDTLPPKLKTLEDEEAVIDNLLNVWKNSQESIFWMKGETAQEKLKNLLTERLSKTVIIDVAGSFREVSLTSLCETILDNRPAAKGVLLFDEEGRELVYEREARTVIPRTESLLESEELFIFIRKYKAVGTDTEMPSTACAIVTVDRDTHWDLLYQGIGRMRKLNLGQVVGFAVEEADRAVVFRQKKHLFKHLAAYTLGTQGRQKGEDAFYVLRLFLEDLIEAAFWDAASACKTTMDVKDLFRVLKEFMIQETQTKPLSCLRKKRGSLPAVEAVDQLKETMLEPIVKFCKLKTAWSSLFNISEISKQFDAYVDYSKLPKEIAFSTSEETLRLVEVDITQVVDDVTEKVTDQTTDLSLEQVSDKMTELPNCNYKPARPLPWDGDYTELFLGQPQANLLGIPVYYSPNFARVSENSQENTLLQKPAYQYVIYQDGYGKYKIALLDLHDARVVIKRMLGRQNTPSYENRNYYLLSGSAVIAYDSVSPKFSLNSEKTECACINILRKFYSAHPLTERDKKYLASLDSKMNHAFFDYVKRWQKVWPHLD